MRLFFCPACRPAFIFSLAYAIGIQNRPGQTPDKTNNAAMSLATFSTALFPGRTDSLYAWTLAYLLLPLPIFYLGWLSLPFGCMLCLALMLAGARACSGTARSCPPSKNTGHWRKTTSWLSAVVLLAAWLSISGIGGVGHQNYDWDARNSLLYALMTHPWPLMSESGGQSRPVIYFMGYFLPASLAGTLFGWKTANAVLWLWTFAGTLLSFQWLVRLSGWRSIKSLYWCALLFIFFSGMDLIGNYFTKPLFGGIWHLETWLEFLELSSNTTLLYWVPNHTLCGWLLVSLLMYEGLQLKRASNACFLAAIAPLWSLYAGIGLLPFGLLVLFGARLRGAFSFQNIWAFAMGALMLLYYLASTPQPNSTGWLGATMNLFQGWPDLFLFFFLEFGLCALLIFHCSPELRRNSQLKWWFLASVAVLLLFPWYRLGGVKTHELYMRGSIPALFVLLVFAARVYGMRKRSFWSHTGCVLLLVVLLIGAGTGMAEISRSLMLTRLETWLAAPNTPASVQQNAPHYLGARNNFFFRHIAKNRP